MSDISRFAISHGWLAKPPIASAGSTREQAAVFGGNAIEPYSLDISSLEAQ